MISYDVIGDYMSDLDDVRKRIEKRKRPKLSGFCAGKERRDRISCG